MTDVLSPLSENLSLDDVPLAFVDLETTGLNPSYGDRICEVAILRYVCNERDDSLEQLVNPLRSISPGAYAVNGISAEMLRDAPTFEQMAGRVSALLEGAVLVGHNVAFDLGFLIAELRAAGRSLPPVVALDTCKLARHSLEAPSYSLGRLARHIGLPLNGREHRAMTDVETTRALFQHVTDLLWRRGVRTLGQLIQAQGGALGYGQPVPLDVPPVIREALECHALLQLTYISEGGQRTERLTRPTKLLVWEGRVTLVAYCYLRQALRHFRLDRIVQIELVGPDDERAHLAHERDALQRDAHERDVEANRYARNA